MYRDFSPAATRKRLALTILRTVDWDSWRGRVVSKGETLTRDELMETILSQPHDFTEPVLVLIHDDAVVQEMPLYSTFSFYVFDAALWAQVPDATSPRAIKAFQRERAAAAFSAWNDSVDWDAKLERDRAELTAARRREALARSAMTRIHLEITMGSCRCASICKPTVKALLAAHTAQLREAELVERELLHG